MKKKHASLVMGYWQYGTLEELHHRSHLWLSEMAFWKDELRFMHKLINNHFVYFVDAERQKITVEMTNEIRLLESQVNSLEEKVLQHEKALKQVLSSANKDKTEVYRREHGELEELTDDFMASYKAFKKVLFSKADEVLQEEKMQRIISLSG